LPANCRLVTSTCFPVQSIAFADPEQAQCTHRMLRRAGVDTVLHAAGPHTAAKLSLLFRADQSTAAVEHAARSVGACLRRLPHARGSHAHHR
jgi:hypothetical protein